LIPCQPGGRPTQLWETILDKHDPDVLVDLVGSSDDYVKEQQELWSRSVVHWERPTDTMYVAGAVVYAALRRWKRTRQPGTQHVLVNLSPILGKPLALPLAYRFGHLDPRPMNANWVVNASYRSDRHRNFLTVRNIDPSAFAEPDLVRLATQVPLDLSTIARPLDSGLIDYHVLPNLTKIGLPIREPAYWDPRRPHPEHEQFDEAYLRRLVIVAAPDSIEDLCLVWNLRAQRRESRFFPFWVGPEWFGDPGVIKSLHWALSRGAPGLLEEKAPPSLHLLSASMTRSELDDVAATLDISCSTYDRGTLERFFTKEFRVGLDRTSIANFRKGSADVAIPEYDQLGDWELSERIGSTLQIQDYALPRSAKKALRHSSSIAWRLAQDGITGFIDVSYVRPNELRSIYTLDAWSIVSTVASEAGYDAKISDKGRRAIAVLQVLGDDSGLQILCSSRVNYLLRQMSETVKRQAVQNAVQRGLQRLRIDPPVSSEQEHGVVEDVLRDVTWGSQFDRQHYTFDDVKRALGFGVTQEQCHQLLGWLVARRILFQGYKFTCPSCSIERWQSIDRLASVQVCEGCQTSIANPISTGNLQWRYRLNETIGQAIDQGAIPHLLAANRMREWLGDERAPLFGLLPGVLLRPLERGGPPEIEVDLFAIKGQRIIVGECKRGGDRITDATVARFAELGRRLNCSRILYATAADFRDDASALDGAEKLSKPLLVERWEGADLFDQRSGEKTNDPVSFLSHRLKQLVDQ
jgi:hypothetical protein